MTWFLAKLEKGKNYPDTVYWPLGIDAIIPLSDNIIDKLTIFPKKSQVLLCWRELRSSSLHPLVWVSDSGEQECAIDLTGWTEALKGESYRSEHQKPLTARLPFHYHHIPGSIRNLVAKILFGIQSYIGSNKEVFPISYFNAGCEILLGVCNASWNLGIKLPIVILTHDIDTKSGFYWVERVSEIEENYGFRSSWNVVPKRYHINKKVLNRLLENGHEIGLHGLWHNNSEAFLSEEQMTSEFSSLKNFMDELMIKGYKSPSWYRTKTMFKVLPEFFSYDLSCLDNDLICPAGNGGVGFMRPFILDSGLVELPCTLPFEAPLFMGVSPENFVEYWIPKIEFIKASSGMLLVNTHPDPHYLGNNRLLASYENLLKTLADDNWKAKLPGQIVKEIKI